MDQRRATCSRSAAASPAPRACAAKRVCASHAAASLAASKTARTNVTNSVRGSLTRNSATFAFGPRSTLNPSGGNPAS